MTKEYSCGCHDWLSRSSDILDKRANTNQYIAYMLNRTQSMFSYKNLPVTVPKRDLELMLQTNGFACFTKVDKNGRLDLDKGDLYAFFGGIGGEYNPYYMPTKVIVANPALGFNRELTINKDCVVIPNDSLYIGLLPMFRKYANALAENDISIFMADVQSRIMILITAGDDASKEAAKSYLKDVLNGKLGVIGDNTFLESIKTQKGAEGAHNLITQLIELQQYLKAGWFNDLGLNACYNMKREAINSNEAQMSTDALLPLVDNMLECRRTGLEKVNEMFGTNISVELSSSWEDRKEIIDAEIKNTNPESGEGESNGRTDEQTD